MVGLGPNDTMPSSAGPALFVIGGARSGKSRYAQRWVEDQCAAHELQPVYLATGQAYDAEMEERIERHRRERGGGWTTVECPLDLPSTILAEAHPGRILLVDCLTLWLSNMMLSERPLDEGIDALASALFAKGAQVAIVSNEVGLSIVPENALARRFRDEQGRLNQRVAESARKVVFVAAGLPLTLKGGD
jgi:adenosylcobinamide kinase/adenosylcobinamide-phosphate guanylyltransferase